MNISTTLTPEEIRRCIEDFKPEGFEYVSSMQNGRYGQIKYLNDFFYLQSVTWMKTLYPLFLTRCIEGINKIIKDVAIVTFWDGKGWWCYDCGLDRFDLPMTVYATPDQAKEQAIKYILDHTEEDKL